MTKPKKIPDPLEYAYFPLSKKKVKMTQAEMHAMQGKMAEMDALHYTICKERNIWGIEHSERLH